MIENVKFEYLKKIKKVRLEIEIDKSIFTMEENFSDKKIGFDTFYENEKKFFNDLLNVTDTKHYKNLRFLSSKHFHKTMKLRFVHKPFSFIFLLEGNKNYHIVWEVLDTKEATYVSHIKKRLLY